MPFYFSFICFLLPCHLSSKFLNDFLSFQPHPQVHAQAFPWSLSSEQYLFLGIVRTDSLPPSHHSFQNTVLFHPCLYADLSRSGPPCTQTVLHGGIPHFPKNLLLQPFSDVCPWNSLEKAEVGGTTAVLIHSSRHCRRLANKGNHTSAVNMRFLSFLEKQHNKNITVQLFFTRTEKNTS